MPSRTHFLDGLAAVGEMKLVFRVNNSDALKVQSWRCASRGTPRDDGWARRGEL